MTVQQAFPFITETPEHIADPSPRTQSTRPSRKRSTAARRIERRRFGHADGLHLDAQTRERGRQGIARIRATLLASPQHAA